MVVLRRHEFLTSVTTEIGGDLGHFGFELLVIVERQLELRLERPPNESVNARPVVCTNVGLVRRNQKVGLCAQHLGEIAAARSVVRASRFELGNGCINRRVVVIVCSVVRRLYDSFRIQMTRVHEQPPNPYLIDNR